MLLDIKGLEIPPQYRKHAFPSDPPLPKDHIFRKPDHLVPLEQAHWPQNVKAKIVEFYKEIGIEDPLRQKLVEPHALAFGGSNEDGKINLKFVNWDKVVDYFEWEAAAWHASYEFFWLDIDPKDSKAEKLQQKALRKYGGYYSHYPVYEDGEY